MDTSEAPKAVAFQVTLKEAEGVSPFKPIENKEPFTEGKIKQKLDLAEERRLSLKSQKQEQAAKELKRVQEKKQKLHEEDEIKRKKIELQLATDLEVKEQNRKIILEEKKCKLQKRLQAHAKNVEEINAVLEDARKQLSERINSEMELAEDRRNKQLGDLLDRIKEHGSKIWEVKKSVGEAHSAYTDQLEEKHVEKLENGIKNRQEQLNQLLERLKEHAIHVENVRKNKKTATEGMEES